MTASLLIYSLVPASIDLPDKIVDQRLAKINQAGLDHISLRLIIPNRDSYFPPFVKRWAIRRFQYLGVLAP